MKTPIYIRIEPDLKEWLEKKSTEDLRTISDYVRIVLQEHREKEGKAK